MNSNKQNSVKISTLGKPHFEENIVKVQKSGGHDLITKKTLEELSFGLDRRFVDLDLILERSKLSPLAEISSYERNNHTAETAAYMAVSHPDYNLLAGRISIWSLHQQTKESFSAVIKDMYEYKDKTGSYAGLISQEVNDIVMENAELIDKEIQHQRDYDYDFFGYKTLEKSYLHKLNGKTAERPQHLLMRVSIGIHKKDLENAFKTYHYMSQKWFVHATPTLFNSGTNIPQMSSCFLLSIQEDSIHGIFDTLKQCAMISKAGGGIGVSISNVRASGSYIKGTGGTSKGLIPFIKLFNDTARYVDQGGKRKGAFALYLEPWHADVVDFLHLKKNHGKEENRARDLFYALWIPDLFMERVENDENWTLMCPNECPRLPDCWGEEFNELYTKYEKEGRGKKVVRARYIWNEIVQSQIETGVPYMVYKDSSNRKSNQKNLGTIKCSNLCTEIIEYTSRDEVAICNLGSISLPKFVNKNEKTFDFEKLYEITYFLAQNLNKVIDENFYPVIEGKSSNFKHRPIGIGVQGLADALILMRVPYQSQKALEIDRDIFETIYYAALRASHDLAKRCGAYESFKGSPASGGILQFDLWDKVSSKRYPWDELKEEIKKHGLRNSLLVAPMPTASTSQILGNNESFEPYTSNLYTRRVLAGEFVCINPHLIRDLIQLNLWTYEFKNKLIAHNGSVQDLSEVPEELKELYKTVWEIPQKHVLDRAIARGPYIDQSQSLNIHMKEPTYSKLCSMHFYAWKGGLKTGMYYLRTQPAADAIKFTVDIEALLSTSNSAEINKSAFKNIASLRSPTLISNTDKISTDGEESVKCGKSKKDQPMFEMCFNCGS